MKTLIKYAITMLMVVGLGHKASATALTIGDSRDLGLVEFAIPSGDADRTGYVNHLIDMAINTSDTALGQTFYRSAVNPASLPDAVWASNDGNSGSYNLGSGFLYVIAKYDGPNYGAVVWYIDGLANIEIPLTAGGYGLSGVTFFNPASVSVPDGGLTLAFLGTSIGLLGFIRRKVSV